MARIPFHELEIIPQRRNKLKKRYKRGNVGLDTETYMGKVKIIADSSGRCIEPKSDIELLRFLNYRQYRGKIGWFWNLRYDFDSVVKWLPLDIVRELFYTSRTDYEGFKIEYIKGKYFELSRDKHHTRFYDMANFLPMSLETASQTYLKTGKFKDVDSKRLNTDKKYWEMNIEFIKKYCVRDAQLTQMLADYFWGLVNSTTGLLPNKPYSQGSYSQDYFLEKCFIPQVQDIPTEVLNYAYQSYYGGRFELLQRGHFEKIYIYDIKSAYPAVMAEMPDFTRGSWVYTDELNPDYQHGFYQCQVIAMNDVISPFMQKYWGLNCYCNGRFNCYLTGYEIDYINRYFPSSEINVYDGFYWIPEGKELHPFAEEIERLYTWKEQEKDENIKYVLKMTLNALSGKLIQTVGGHTGKLFNPLYAAECTARTRLKLLEAARLTGINNVVGFSTDAIHTTRSFNPVKTRDDALGDFIEDFRGEGLYILSDVYSAWNLDREKNRFRGMYIDMESLENKKKKTIRVKDMLTQMGDQATVYRYDVVRPVHLGEVIKHTQRESILNLNLFHTSEKRIDINGDKKRLWDPVSFVSAAEALETHHVSEPLVLGV